MTEDFEASLVTPSTMFVLPPPPPPYAEHSSATSSLDVVTETTHTTSEAEVAALSPDSSNILQKERRKKNVRSRRKDGIANKRSNVVRGDDGKNDMVGEVEDAAASGSRVRGADPTEMFYAGYDRRQEVLVAREAEIASGVLVMAAAAAVTTAEIEANVYRFRARRCLSLAWVRHMWQLTIDRGELVETRLTGVLEYFVTPMRRLWLFMMRSPQLSWLVLQFEAFLRWIFTGTDWSSHVAWILGGTVGYTRILVKSVGAVYDDLYRVRKTYFCVVACVLMLFAFWNETLAHVQAPTSLLHHNVRLVSAVTAFRHGSLGLFLALGLPTYLPFVLLFLTVKNALHILAWMGGWLFAVLRLFWEALRLMSKTFTDEVIPGCINTASYVVLEIIMPLCKLAVAIPFWGLTALAAVFTGLMAILVTGMSLVWMVVAVIGRGAYAMIEGGKAAPDKISTWFIHLFTSLPPTNDPNFATSTSPENGTSFSPLAFVCGIVLAALVFFARMRKLT